MGVALPTSSAVFRNESGVYCHMMVLALIAVGVKFLISAYNPPISLSISVL